jgi:hypothetical protein
VVSPEGQWRLIQIDPVHGAALAALELLLTLFVSVESKLRRDLRMKDFSNASFAPDTIKTMTAAMNGAIATLPHPVSSAHVQSVAETILRTAKDGERDPKVLERMALLELQISPRPSAISSRP